MRQAMFLRGASRFRRLRLLVTLLLLAAGGAVWLTGAAEDEKEEPPAPGLRDLAWSTTDEMTEEERRLVMALKQPMINAMNVRDALECWFRGRRADESGKLEEARKAWLEGLTKLKDLQPLPKAVWGPPPDATLKIRVKFRYPDTDGVDSYIVEWKVGRLRQYGVLMLPAGLLKRGDVQAPLLLYLHGAAYGVPLYALPWLAKMVRAGYAVIGPAMRGEDLFATTSDLNGLNFKCEGKIENLDGEVDDALSAAVAARKLPCVKDGSFAIIGHSFGAGVGLLAGARAPDAVCVVSYDAWLVNPFRYYWDRMRRGPNNWLSWEQYCNQPVDKQLAGLMKRSITHHAERVHCPLLMFIGGAYAGSVFHLSHEDFIQRLRKYKKSYVYDVVPGGGHNFVLYYESEPARYAFRKHMEFLKRWLPPSKKAAQIAEAAARAANSGIRTLPGEDAKPGTAGGDEQRQSEENGGDENGDATRTQH